MSRIRKVREIFWKLLGGAAWVFFFLMIIAMLMQVFTRYVTKTPIAWTEEFSRFTYVWAIFLGSILVQRTRSHMVVSIVIDKLSPRARLVMESLSDIFSIIVMALVFAGTLMMMKKTYGILASTIPISYSYVYLALSIGSFFILVLLFADVIKSVKSLFAAKK